MTVLCQASRDEGRPYTKRILPEHLIWRSPLSSKKLVGLLEAGADTAPGFIDSACTALGCIDAGLLILDDFAFRPYSQLETELLYTLSDERLTEGSIIVTSNRPPKDWFAVFPDPIVGSAILDRLVSGAVKLIVTSGRSYRKEGGHRNEP